MKNFLQVFILSDIDRKSCTNLAKHFWPSGYTVSGFSKLHSTCLEELFEGTFWSRKLFCFDDVSGHWLDNIMAKIFWLSIEFFFKKVVWIAFYVSGKPLGWKLFSRNFVIVFAHWANFFRASVENFLEGLLKLHCTCSVNHFEEERSLRVLWFLIGFGYWAKCFRLRLEISLNRIVKVEISILRVQRNAFKNVFFENFMFSFTFGGWAKFFGPLANFLNMVVRTASDASIITLWGKLFYWTESFRVFIIPGP